MRIRLLAFFLLFTVTSTALFSYVLLDRAHVLSDQDRAAMILQFNASLLNQIPELPAETLSAKWLSSAQLPSGGHLFVAGQGRSVLLASPDTLNPMQDKLDAMQASTEPRGYQMGNGSVDFAWARGNYGDYSVYAILTDDHTHNSYWEGMTTPFVITAIILLWLSVWASQVIGNLLARLEHQRKDLDKKNHQLEHSLKELEIARDQALAASKTKSSFLANMSHELRTPLNAIIGYSELIFDEIKSGTQPVQEDIGKILRSGRHLLGLINDVLDLSKIEAGKMDSFIEQVNIYKTVQDVIASINPLVEKAGNTLEVNCSETIGFFESDVTKVRQILFNLIGNANKFTHHGRITLDVERVGENTDQPKLVFTVSDTGIGMTSQQLGRLFQAFSQADATTTREYGGTGLGLTISKHLSQILGGDISVASQEDKGSVFTVVLPIHSVMVTIPDAIVDIGHKVDPREVRLGADGAEIDPRRSKVSSLLVIDDDANVRDIMERFLTRQGFFCHTAASADEGIELAQEVLPDLIILDVMMPEKDGWQALAELKEIDSVQDIPVVMLTLAGNRELGLSLGATEQISKPINWDEVMRAIYKYVRTDKSS